MPPMAIGLRATASKKRLTVCHEARLLSKLIENMLSPDQLKLVAGMSVPEVRCLANGPVNVLGCRRLYGTCPGAESPLRT